MKKLLLVGVMLCAGQDVLANKHWSLDKGIKNSERPVVSERPYQQNCSFVMVGNSLVAKCSATNSGKARVSVIRDINGCRGSITVDASGLLTCRMNSGNKAYGARPTKRQLEALRAHEAAHSHKK